MSALRSWYLAFIAPRWEKLVWQQRAMVLVVPSAFALGAGMELFMIKTGFYDLARKREGERLLEEQQRRAELKERRARKQRKQAEKELTRASAAATAGRPPS